jgi:hypothetical protein
MLEEQRDQGKHKRVQSELEQLRCQAAEGTKPIERGNELRPG